MTTETHTYFAKGFSWSGNGVVSLNFSTTVEISSDDPMTDVYDIGQERLHTQFPNTEILNEGTMMKNDEATKDPNRMMSSRNPETPPFQGRIARSLKLVPCACDDCGGYVADVPPLDEDRYECSCDEDDNKAPESITRFLRF